MNTKEKKYKMNKHLSICVMLILANTIYAQSIKFEAYEFKTRDGRIESAELGTMLVPENRNHPESKNINIKCVRFKSTSDNPGSPIVYLAGGPGGSGIAAGRGSRFDMFMALRQIGDVILLDQRGTGISDGIPNYPGYWLIDPAQPLNRADATKIIQEETLKAVQFWQNQGVDIAAYNTNSSADDINDLRIALGKEKLNIIGISYGTHLALTYLKRHEAHADRIILAGVEGYDHTVKLPMDQQDLLETIDQLLKEDATTKDIYPDFLGDIEKLLSQLETNPVEVETVNPLDGKPMTVMTGKMEMQILIAMMLRGPSNFRSLPLELKQMLVGDFSAIKDWILYTHAGQLRGMSLAMDVASGISKDRLMTIKKQREKTLLGDAINWPYLEQWKVLQDFHLSSEFRASFASDLPVLCISGTLDGRTPPGNAVEVLSNMKNGHHLVIEGAGHSDPLFLSSPRILEVMEDFLNGKSVGNETISLPPVQWELPGSSTEESVKN